MWDGGKPPSISLIINGLQRSEWLIFDCHGSVISFSLEINRVLSLLYIYVGRRDCAERHSDVGAVWDGLLGSQYTIAETPKIPSKHDQSVGGWVENSHFPTAARAAKRGGYPKPPYICV